MATSTLVPLSEYLQTTYDPDCDWIDGDVRERNVGEGAHGCIQGFFIGFFRDHGKEWDVRVWPELRVQVAATRYRIPDVCVTRRSAPFEQIIRTPPLLCIEILSRDQRMSEIVERIEDYFRMGVETAWIVDPLRRLAFAASQANPLIAVSEELVVAGSAIRVSLSEIFEELDELEGRASG